ncbi:MAG TPA: hypothetical protein GXX30_00560 [Firmicutes bacterium]|uniref:Uncharacterized protein n=1 Tax=Candidatus Fermentithermobacillus carboniphilus TaxID=3085328 RepID=A0AAT9LAL7_9FIRM|nr:MAG: hypothetical protein IMF26_06790 [Candidatus Fermentithermobacillus carboniphilus]HHW17388.1 hypothetical protein [Candidatus Fermentithermobacillaceae bacterium]
MDPVVKALKTCAPKLLGLPNVIGYGRGHRHVGGRNTGEPVLTVLVKKKVPKDELQSCHMIPKSLNQCPTDVIEVGEVVALSRTDRERPARPGMSIGHYRITAGTFGAVVYDVKTGEPLILSNNHVLANSTNGKDGRARIGDPILQPGRYDGGTDQDVIARLHRFVPIHLEVSSPECKVAATVENVLNKIVKKFRRNYQVKIYNSNPSPNLVDAAVAKPISDSLIVPDIIDLGVPRGIAEVAVGDRVVKSGRTSGTNWGQVKVVQATIKISMGDMGDAVFSDQVITTRMAQPGDSGSVVLNDKGQVCGLLSAGSDTVSVFGRIKNVCDAIGVRF